MLTYTPQEAVTPHLDPIAGGRSVQKEWEAGCNSTDQGIVTGSPERLGEPGTPVPENVSLIFP